MTGGIRRIAHEYGAVTVFRAYFEMTDLVSPRSVSIRSDLQACGVSLIDCPHNGRKDVADKMMLGTPIPVDRRPRASNVFRLSQSTCSYTPWVAPCRRRSSSSPEIVISSTPSPSCGCASSGSSSCRPPPCTRASKRRRRPCTSGRATSCRLTRCRSSASLRARCASGVAAVHARASRLRQRPRASCRRQPLQLQQYQQQQQRTSQWCLRHPRARCRRHTRDPGFPAASSRGPVLAQHQRNILGRSL